MVWPPPNPILITKAPTLSDACPWIGAHGLGLKTGRWMALDLRFCIGSKVLYVGGCQIMAPFLGYPKIIGAVLQ